MYKLFSKNETINDLAAFAKQPEIYLTGSKACGEGLIVYYDKEERE